MVMRWERDLEVQDVRNHSPEVVRGLQSLLLKGASLTPDMRHPGFFEIEAEDRVYYVHLVPNSGKVLLLAAWSSDREFAAASGAA